MIAFGVGTIPFMSALIFYSNLIKMKFKRFAIPIRTAVILFVAIFMVYRGSENLHKEMNAPKLGESFEVCG